MADEQFWKAGECKSGRKFDSSPPFRCPALPSAIGRDTTPHQTKTRSSLISPKPKSLLPLCTSSLLLSLSRSLKVEMSLPAQRNCLRTFIQTMHDEGIVNGQFCELQFMKEIIGRDYAVRVITRFCMASIDLFSSLTDQIYQQQVDFQKVHVLTRELYARTTWVGAEGVRHASTELLYACDIKDKNHCFWALYWTKHEFSYLRRNLEILVQLERRIIDLENMQ